MVHAIKSRICALFISVVVLIIGIVGGAEAQTKMIESFLDELELRRFNRVISDMN